MLICPDCGSSEVTHKVDKTGCNRYYCHNCKGRHKPNVLDDEIVATNVRLAKQKQKQMDLNRIKEKSYRENARIENAFEAYSEALVTELKEIGKKFVFTKKLTTPPIETGRGLEVGFIQLTDHHLNELIDRPSNKYDIEIASQRLRKLADEAIWLFTMRGIKRVVLEFGGDLLNSDRRLDEKLSQATNRARATILAVELYMAFISHLRTYFEIDIVGVLGNEGRADQEMLHSTAAASNNYDYTIVAMLKMLIEASDIDNVRFGPIDQLEQIVEINGQRVLMIHDITKQTDTQVKTQSLIGRYFLQKTPIDYVISGHIHTEKTTAFASRGASLAGSNGYNENGLGLISRASQQIGYFGTNYRNMTSIDLQDVDGIEGYQLQHQYMAYNSKSDKKNVETTPIFQVII